ncbi:MAG: YfhO family protein [Thermodesulfobacteriota bacterium]
MPRFRLHSGTMAPALLALLAVLFFVPVLSPGRSFYPFDTLFAFLPWSAMVPGFPYQNPLITDTVNQHYLSYQLLRESLQHGGLPLWDDRILCGLPFVLGFSPHLNPVVLGLHLVLPLTKAHDALLFLYMLGTGFFTYLYLRQMSLHVLPAVLGAVAWMFNGYVLVWFEFEFSVILSCSMAASLLFLERWLKSRTRLDALLFTAAVCLGISSGMVHLVLYQLLFVGAYLVHRYSSLRKGPDSIRALSGSDALTLGLSVALGLAVSAPLTAGYLAFFHDPQRSQFSFRDLFHHTGQLHPAYLLTLLFPDLFGNPAVSRFSFMPRASITQIYTNYNELCIYAGVVPLYLALACAPLIRRRPLVAFFSLAGLCCLTMAMGSVLYYPLARFIPGLGYSTPTRILYLFGFCMAILGALGAERLLLGDLKERKGAVLVVWSLLFLVAVAVFLLAQREGFARWTLCGTQWKDALESLPEVRKYLVPGSRALLEPVVFSGLTFLLLLPGVITNRRQPVFLCLLLATGLAALDLVSFGRTYNTVSSKDLEFPVTGGIRMLQQDNSLFRVATAGHRFMHNTLAPFGVDDLGGYVSVYPRRYGEFLHVSEEGPQAPIPDHFSRWVFLSNFGSPLLDLVNVKYVLMPPGWRIESPAHRLVYTGEITIYENLRAFPRAFFVKDHLLAPGRREALHALGAFSHVDFRTRVILEKPPPASFTAGSRPGERDTGASVSIVSHRPHRVEIRVTNPVRGFLVLGDNYDPGWRVAVDGRVEEVMRADYILRAVPLEAGSHHVVFFYRPVFQIAALAATGAAWLVMLAGIVVLTVRRRPGTKPGSLAQAQNLRPLA